MTDRFNTQHTGREGNDGEPEVWRMVVKEIKYKGNNQLMRCRRVRVVNGSNIEGTADYPVVAAYTLRPVGSQIDVLTRVAGGTGVQYSDGGKTYDAQLKEIFTMPKPRAKYQYLACVDDDLNIDWDGLRFM